MENPYQSPRVASDEQPTRLDARSPIFRLVALVTGAIVGTLIGWGGWIVQFGDPQRNDHVLVFAATMIMGGMVGVLISSIVWRMLAPKISTTGRPSPYDNLSD